MARRDLEEMRDEIASYGYLTADETMSLQYYGENRLREMLADLEAIAEEEERAQMEPLYYEEGFDDYGDWWEIEIVFDGDY